MRAFPCPISPFNLMSSVVKRKGGLWSHIPSLVSPQDYEVVRGESLFKRSFRKEVQVACGGGTRLHRVAVLQLLRALPRHCLLPLSPSLWYLQWLFLENFAVVVLLSPFSFSGSPYREEVFVCVWLFTSHQDMCFLSVHRNLICLLSSLQNCIGKTLFLALPNPDLLPRYIFLPIPNKTLTHLIGNIAAFLQLSLTTSFLNTVDTGHIYSSTTKSSQKFHLKSSSITFLLKLASRALPYNLCLAREMPLRMTPSAGTTSVPTSLRVGVACFLGPYSSLFISFSSWDFREINFCSSSSWSAPALCKAQFPVSRS